MDTSYMLKQMCRTVLSVADLKAICKSRGFIGKETASRAIFENFFLSDIGVEAALGSLTSEEIIFLHLLKRTDKAVDLTLFERLYGSAKSGTSYYYGTFSQQYKTTFKRVKESLVRKGVLLIAEALDDWGASTKMEKWRFRFPTEFAEFLPPMIEPATFAARGDHQTKVLRGKLLQIVGERQRRSQLKDESVYALNVTDGELLMGEKGFSVERLLEWQRACWTAAGLGKIKRKKGEITPITAVLYAFSQLTHKEWLLPEQLTVPFRLFTGEIGTFDAEQVCGSGWKWGVLVRYTAEGKRYYRLVDDLQSKSASPERYLQIEPDGSVVVDLQAVHYKAVDDLSQIATWQVHDSCLSAFPHVIKIGNAPTAVRDGTLALWLQENAPAFRTAMEQVTQRWGKQIVHENLLVARVKDLSLKVRIEKVFPDQRQVVFLPNDYIAFPCDLLALIEAVVRKSGHVIKRAKE
ncbi:hypothetical protein LR032_05590 [Candidatus Bipolaricaulota bacterium]|nr:hypothetical protein [Candidatus Bipolaricaulota bacterium]